MTGSKPIRISTPYSLLIYDIIAREIDLEGCNFVLILTGE